MTGSSLILYEYRVKMGGVSYIMCGGIYHILGYIEKSDVGPKLRHNKFLNNIILVHMATCVYSTVLWYKSLLALWRLFFVRTPQLNLHYICDNSISFLNAKYLFLVSLILLGKISINKNIFYGIFHNGETMRSFLRWFLDPSKCV